MVVVSGVHILGAAAMTVKRKSQHKKEELEFDPKESAKKLVKRMDRLIQQQSEGHDAKIPGEIPSSLPPLPVFNEEGEPQAPTFTSVGEFLTALSKVPSYAMYKKMAEVGVSGSNHPNGLLLLCGVQLQEITPPTSRHWMHDCLSCCIGYTTALPGIFVCAPVCHPLPS